MRSFQTQEIIELTRAFPDESTVSFDSDSAALEGSYKDELSAFRARKVWIETLENLFLLEKDYDFRTKISGSIEKGTFIVRCDFLTACGRYAFWRVTNDQAPEAQYTIETAHIPNSDTFVGNYISAPDLRKKSDLPLYLEKELLRAAKKTWSIKSLIQRLITD